jgi:MFS family permease
LVEGALYTASFALLNFQVVYPALIQKLGGGDIAIGSLGVIYYLCYMLPQLVAANYVAMEPYRRPWVMGVGIAQRIQVLLIAVIIAALGTTLPTLALILFFVFFSLNQIIAGVVGPSWFDFVVKTTLPYQRGRLMGLRASIGAGLGFLNGVVLAALLTYTEFPWNYSLAFLIAFGFQLSSWFVQRRIKEETPSPMEAPVPISRLLARASEIVRSDKHFRNFLIASALLVVGLMPQGFFIVAAIKRFDLPESSVAFFTMTMLASQVIFAGLLGWLGDLRGHKVSLVICASAMGAASIIAVFAQHPAWFFAVFSFIGLIFGVEMMTRHNFVAELVSDQLRPLYLGIMNAWFAPFFLSSLFGGWLSDQFGYPAVFMVGAAFSLTGLALLLRIPDPRFMHQPHLQS